MNSEESPGGSSCDGQENGDWTNGSERPLKKARFAWQVKGKYHLKNDKSDPTKISTTVSTAPEMSGPSGSDNYASDCNNIGQDISIETNQNLYTSDSLVDEPDKSVLIPSTGNLGSEDNVFTPNATVANNVANPQKNVRSQEHDEYLSALNLMERPIGNNNGRTQEKITQTYANGLMPTTEEYMMYGRTQEKITQTYANGPTTEEYMIASWQYRQIIKVNLDNSINQILENMNAHSVGGEITMLGPQTPEVECVENEGILMAISAHGLQNTSGPSSFFARSRSSSRRAEDINVPIRIRFTPIIEDESDDESQEEFQHEYECTLNNVEWTLTNQLRNMDNETIPSPTFHGTSSLNLNYENLHNTDAASNEVAIESENHHDFLEAAVSTAILSKGLTTSGTDYG